MTWKCSTMWWRIRKGGRSNRIRGQETATAGRMRRRNSMTGWMAAVVLALAAVVASPCLAQRNNFRSVPHTGSESSSASSGQGMPATGCATIRGLSPGEQERALQNDPGLSPFVSGAPAVVAAAAAAFLQSSAAATAAHAEPHGNLGASDAGTEATGAAGSAACSSFRRIVGAW